MVNRIEVFLFTYAYIQKVVRNLHSYMFGH